MLTLYYKPSCPFCVRVLAAIERMQVEVNLIDINTDSKYRDELIEKGGKKQVPYFVDDEKDVAMYESDDIIEYLENNYGSGDTSQLAKVRVHNVGKTCGND